MTASITWSNATIVEGDHKIITFTLYDSDGVLYDFTGTTKVWFTLKNNETDAFTDALLALNSADHPTQVEYGIPDPGSGKIRITFDNGDTEGFAVYGMTMFDIQILKNSNIETLIISPFPAFRHEITEATS